MIYDLAQTTVDRQGAIDGLRRDRCLGRSEGSKTTWAQVFQAPFHRPSFETLTPSQASALPFSPALNPAGPALSDAHVHQAHLTAEPWALPSQPCPHRPLPSPAPRHDPTSRVRRPVPRRGPDQQHRRVLLQPDQHVTSARPHDRPLTHPRVALRAPQRIMAERSEHQLIPRDPRPSPNTDGPGSAGPGRLRPCDAAETKGGGSANGGCGGLSGGRRAGASATALLARRLWSAARL